MIPNLLRVMLIVALVLYFVIILVFLKNKTLELKYTLLWMAAGGVLTFLLIWPEFLSNFVRLVGIQSNMNGLFLFLFAFLIMIMMSLTSIVSKQANKIKLLIQEIAIAEKKIRDLEIMRMDEKNGEKTSSN